ncbi:MAG: Mrp/NBP35 family ATP-binding protein [Spirochaetota bacterium]
MSINKEEVRKALSNVIDPELREDLVTLNMIKDIEIKDSNKVIVTVELTTPACPLKNTIANDCRNEVSKVPGVEDVEIKFTAREKKTEKEIKLDKVKNIIAVSSGKGGVGKSTVAALLALSFAKKGYKVGLMDADAYGPNIPTLLDNFDRPFANEKNKIIPVELRNIKFVSLGLLVDAEKPIIWRGPMLHGLVSQFLKDVEWGELDILFVDLPPGTGDVQLSLAQLIDLTGGIMVTTPQKLSIADTQKGIAMFRQLQIDVLGIIENMSYFEAPDTGKKYDVFSSEGGKKLAEKLNIPLLGQLPLNMDISDPSKDSGIKYFEPIIEGIEGLNKLKK